MRVADENMHWFLLLCKGGHDHRVEMQLGNLGYIYYRPLIRKKGKKRANDNSFISLFPGYIFVNLTIGISDFSKVMYLPGVSKFVVFGERYAVMSEQVINSIKAAEGKHCSEHSNEVNFRKNDKVFINSSGFNNVEAIFRERVGENRSLLLLKFLSKSRSVIVKDSCVSPEPIYNQY